MYNKDIMEEGMQKGLQKGIKESIYKTALRMLDKNLKPSQTAEYTGLSVKQIRQLKEKDKK